LGRKGIWRLGLSGVYFWPVANFSGREASQDWVELAQLGLQFGPY
jgi:hypothetical protein